VTHPSAEEVAEHLEGLLGPDDDRRVREHVAGCADCAATVAALTGVSGSLRRAADEIPPIPADVEIRVRDAIAAESARASAGGAEPTAEPADEPVAGRVAASPVPESEVHAGPAVTPLDQRRRRRRALAGGLLAAAAATVVVVGVGEVLGGGGAGDLAVSEQAGSAGGQAESDARPLESAAGRPGVAADERGPLTLPGLGAQDQPGRDQELSFSGVALVESIADRHRPEAAGSERAGCVRSVLGDGARSAASYAVTLPGGSTPGAVVLRPGDSPTVGLLLDCGPRPALVLRHTLAR
jgi:anti-sigma factor RsiW